MNAMPVALLLSIPLAAAAATLFLRRRAFIEAVHLTAAAAIFLSAAFLARDVLAAGTLSFFHGFFHADALSALVTFLTALVFLIAAPYTVGFFRRPAPGEGAPLGGREIRNYHALTHLFVFTLLAVSLTGNLGLMWVALEGATLASVFLVAFYGKPTSLEAAWKYAILGGVGLSMALFGTILTYYAAHQATGGETREALNWPFLASASRSFDPLVMRLAFILILLGYGAKAGLAPMHTWKPDAYSEAPVPVAALMATAMLNCALYGLMRFSLLAAPAAGTTFAANLLALFGVLSIAVAVPFILVQRSARRLLAYSSIEHCGIISLGLGLGGPLGPLGAMLHMLYHSAAKPLLFFCAGNVQQHTGNDTLRKSAGGLIHVLPVTGAAFFAAALAVTGTPPFPLFLSEFTILRAAFARGMLWVALLVVALLVAIFAGLFSHVSRLVFGPRPDLARGDLNRWTTWPLPVLAAALLAMSFWIPGPLLALVEAAAKILEVRP